VLGFKFEVSFDTQLLVINVALVMANGPFSGFLGPDRVRPSEPHDARADGDAELSGLRLDTSTPGTARPRQSWFEQCRSRGDHLGAREPQPQCVERPQLTVREPVDNRVADIFGTYNKPAGRGWVEAGCRGGRTADRWRSPALRPGGLGRSRSPVHRGTR
jgi:hypothetical protein